MELNHSILLDTEVENVILSFRRPRGTVDITAVVVPEIVHDFLSLRFVAQCREICDQLGDSSGLGGNLSIFKVSEILQQLSFLSIEISYERLNCGHVFFQFLNIFKQLVDQE